MKIAVEGQGVNTTNTYNQLPGMSSRQTVLLDLIEAEKLYQELHKLFGDKLSFPIAKKVDPISVPTPSPKTNIPTGKPSEIMDDFLKQREEQKKRNRPYDPFGTLPPPTMPFYCPPPSPFDPGLPGIKYGMTTVSPPLPHGSFGPERD